MDWAGSWVWSAISWMAVYKDGTFSEDYLFNFIDLLIVDEAGQVQPGAAGGAFALARRALVIGDTLQIEPIASLPKSVDIGNLVCNGVLSKVYTEDDLERVEELGVCSTGGSAMQVAQSACRYHPETELSRGLWLFEHRRCYDEIVEYCNALCYKGKLEPRRGGAVGKNGEVPELGPLAYLHVDGFCVSAAGGSRRNTVEAKTIAAWLKAGREELEGRYGKRLEEIVGVVTPFGAQVREIGRASEEVGIKMDGVPRDLLRAVWGKGRWWSRAGGLGVFPVSRFPSPPGAFGWKQLEWSA